MQIQQNHKDLSQLAHTVVSTFIQRYLDVMDVRWTLDGRSFDAGVVALLEPEPAADSPESSI